MNTLLAILGAFGVLAGAYAWIARVLRRGREEAIQRTIAAHDHAAEETIRALAAGDKERAARLVEAQARIRADLAKRLIKDPTVEDVETVLDEARKRRR